MVATLTKRSALKKSWEHQPQETPKLGYCAATLAVATGQNAGLKTSSWSSHDVAAGLTANDSVTRVEQISVPLVMGIAHVIPEPTTGATSLLHEGPTSQ